MANDKMDNLPDASALKAPQEQRLKELELLVMRLENCGLNEYLRVSRSKSKVFLLNFMSGVARGLGFTVGTAIVLALFYKIIAQVVSMNIPYLTDMLTALVEFVKNVR